MLTRRLTGFGPHTMGSVQPIVVFSLGKPFFLGPTVGILVVLRSVTPVLPIAKQRRHVDPQLHPSNNTHFSSDRHSWTQRN